MKTQDKKMFNWRKRGKHLCAMAALLSGESVRRGQQRNSEHCVGRFVRQQFGAQRLDGAVVGVGSGGSSDPHHCSPDVAVLDRHQQHLGGGAAVRAGDLYGSVADSVPSQIRCHVLGAQYGYWWAGGYSWDFETWRAPYQSNWTMLTSRCNWGGDAGYYRL